MSGHSKWSTIKRQKEATDIARGKLFSKLARGISIAAKAGGSSDPDANPKLRMAIEQAKAANMPKENVKRAIEKATTSRENLEEFVYEGFGPNGIAVIVEAATDNRNRTGQEIKNIFERGGGSLAGPGAVSFNFEQKGLIAVEKGADPDEEMLRLIDLGAEDVDEEVDAYEVYVAPMNLSDTKNKIETSGMRVKSAQLIQKPKNLLVINSLGSAKKNSGFFR